MKKRIIITLVVVLLLFPIPMKLKDGGTIEYKAILYQVSDVHKINVNSKSGYDTGIIIKILGFEVYNNVK